LTHFFYKVYQKVLQFYAATFTAFCWNCSLQIRRLNKCQLQFDHSAGRWKTMGNFSWLCTRNDLSTFFYLSKAANLTWQLYS